VINSVALIWHFADTLITDIEEIFKADKPIQSNIVLYAHPSSILPQKRLQRANLVCFYGQIITTTANSSLKLKKKKSLMKDKRNQRGTEAPHSSEPQKAHPTGEFVVVA